MKNSKQNNTHGDKWNSRFIHKVAHAQIVDMNDVSANIIFQYVTSEVLRRVAILIEEALFCDECHVRNGTTIDLVRPDFEMMIDLDFVHFLISAFEQENYDLEVDGDNLEI